MLGEHSPHAALLDGGTLSDGWADTYLRLLQEATQKWKGHDSLPRKIIAAVHSASSYLSLRYDAWRAFGEGRRNAQTEHNLWRLRTPSEVLLLSAMLTHEVARTAG